MKNVLRDAKCFNAYIASNVKLSEKIKGDVREKIEIQFQLPLQRDA